LWDAIARSDLIDMRWQSDVCGIELDSNGVTLAVKSPAGDYSLEADYVLAADGARSTLRSTLGLRLKGENYEGKYVIADIRMDHDFPTERRAFFEPAGNPDGTVLIHKQPDNIWRVDYQLRDGERDEDAIKEENIRARVQAILGDIGHSGPWDLEWWSIYTANTLCLDDYKHGRVIFIGDSAHIVPIFGVRGLNNGLADAHNIGWKLAYVLNKDANLKLLDSYTPERRGATLDVFANATKSTRFMTPPTRGWQLARSAALSLAINNEFTRNFANPRQMQPYTYALSPLTPFPQRDAAFAAGPVSGSAAPDVKLGDGGHLLDRFGDGFTCLWFRDRALDGDDADFLKKLQGLDHRFAALVIATEAGAVPQALISDANGAVARIYGAKPGTFYLLRPDLHVAGRWRLCEPREVLLTMNACIGKPIEDGAVP
jgi:3-(3-hydroxy-phenyl)propionate hydroxylase